MSLLAYLMDRPRRLQDQHFALALTPDDILSIPSQAIRDYYRPWSQISNRVNDYESSIKANKDKFQVNLDVQHFSPEEIYVKTVDGFLVIEGQHNEKKDEHGWVSRKFIRRYQLPEGCNIEAVQSQLSSDGVLTITAPLACAQANERVVPIVQTGPVKTQSDRIEIGNGEARETVENGQLHA